MCLCASDFWVRSKGPSGTPLFLLIALVLAAFQYDAPEKGGLGILGQTFGCRRQIKEPDFPLQVTFRHGCCGRYQPSRSTKRRESAKGIEAMKGCLRSCQESCQESTILQKDCNYSVQTPEKKLKLCHIMVRQRNFLKNSSSCFTRPQPCILKVPAPIPIGKAVQTGELRVCELQKPSPSPKPGTATSPPGFRGSPCGRVQHTVSARLVRPCVTLRGTVQAFLSEFGLSW